MTWVVAAAASTKPSSATWVAAVAASGGLLLGMFVAVAYTRVQARSSKRSADAAELGAARASAPELQLSLNDESEELIIESNGPEVYVNVKLDTWASANSNYLNPIDMLLDAKNFATRGNLGRFVPHQKKVLRYKRVAGSAGGEVLLIFKCVTPDGREYDCSPSVSVPGTPIPASASVAYATPESQVNRSGGNGNYSYPEYPVELLKRLNWAVQRLCACCFTDRSKDLLTGDAEKCLDVTLQLTNDQSFKRLTQGVADFISEFIPGKRRFALYRGNQDVLVSFHDSGWQDSDPPVLKSGSSVLQSEVSSDYSVICPKELFTKLRRGRRFYVQDVDHPPESEYQLVTAIPGGQQFKSFAIAPIRAFPSFAAAEQEDESLLLGAILVQHVNTNALPDERDRDVLSLLGSLLAAALVHLAARNETGASNDVL